MCLTIPKKVVKINGDEIIVETPNGNRQTIKSIVELKSGDFCLTQQNVAVEKIGRKEASHIIKIFNNKE